MLKLSSVRNTASVSLLAISAAIFAGNGVANANALIGEVTINGNVNRTDSGGVVTLDFLDVDDIVTTEDFGLFFEDFTGTGPDATLPVDPPNSIDIKDLNLTSTGFDPSSPSLTSFIDFGTRTYTPTGEEGTLTFDLTEPTSVFIADFVVGFVAEGVWNFKGQTLATGGISMTNAGTSQSYTISLQADDLNPGDDPSVPEPSTLFGLGVAGLGLLASRRKANQK